MGNRYSFPLQSYILLFHLKLPFFLFTINFLHLTQLSLQSVYFRITKNKRNFSLEFIKPFETNQIKNNLNVVVYYHIEDMNNNVFDSPSWIFFLLDEKLD